MAFLLSADYAWIKALHVISVISWMAALLYLPRLFVYHAGAAPGSAQSETFKTMERKLLNAIATPAAVASVVFGAWLVALAPAYLREGWLHGKLTLVAVLIAIHVVLWRSVQAFARDANTRSHVFYRVLNELPAVLMIGIVILVVVRPF
jgi:protoporphyrinogen IX oxidase